MHRRHLLQGLAASLSLPRLGLAQDKYPSKPILWICPYAAGGSGDQRSRQLGRAMSALLGQPIIVDDRAGAGGNIGTAAIAKAAPDGYTIGLGNFAPLAVNASLFKKMSFDPFTDIVPIMQIERGPLMLSVRADSPYKSVKDLVADAKARPGQLSYGSSGVGGTHHLSGALFEHAAGIDLIHAPYKGGAAAATDLLGGQITLMFEQMYAAMPSVKAGKTRALATTGKTRSALAPDVPTMAEAGYPEVEVLNWQGIIGPKGMPAELVSLLNGVANKALVDPSVKEQILKQGNEVVGGTPEQFAVLIRTESARWAKVVKLAKIEPE